MLGLFQMYVCMMLTYAVMMMTFSRIWMTAIFFFFFCCPFCCLIYICSSEYWKRFLVSELDSSVKTNERAGCATLSLEPHAHHLIHIQPSSFTWWHVAAYQRCLCITRHFCLFFVLDLVNGVVSDLHSASLSLSLYPLANSYWPLKLL